MATEYRPVFVAIAFALEQFMNNDFNLELLPKAVEAARRMFPFIKTFATMSTDDFTLDRGIVEGILEKGGLAHFESALSIDFKALPLFLIEDKRGYSSKVFMYDASVVSH
jgi:hypothetical protein